MWKSDSGSLWDISRVDSCRFPILDWFDGVIEEWGSTEPVKPLARMRVSPQDFPYLDKVQFSL